MAYFQYFKAANLGFQKSVVVMPTGQEEKDLARRTLKHFSYISSGFFIIEYQSGHRKYIFFYFEIHLVIY